MIPKNEIWKDVIEFEGLYQISNYGRVKRLERYVPTKIRHITQRLLPARIKKPVLDAYGYQCVILFGNNKYKKFSIHRLVAQAFIPNPMNKAQVNHKNGIKIDNSIENLEWCTYRENEDHAVKNKLKASGEKNGWSKLTDINVLLIRTLYSYGWSQTALAKHYNISITHVGRIIKREVWKHI